MLMPSVTGGSSLVPGSLEILDGRSCSTPLPPVRSARTVSLVSLPALLVLRTPVISSQAPHHRLHHPSPHGPFHGPLVAVARNTVLPQNAPKKVMARRASIMITASPLGEEEAVPSERGAEGVAVPPWKRREAGGVGGLSGPSERRLSSASARGRALRVTERQWRTEHSDKHDAKYGARSGREQLPVRNEVTKRGASSFIVNLD